MIMAAFLAAFCISAMASNEDPSLCDPGSHPVTTGGTTTTTSGSWSVSGSVGTGGVNVGGGYTSGTTSTTKTYTCEPDKPSSNNSSGGNNSNNKSSGNSNQKSSGSSIGSNMSKGHYFGM